MKKHIKLISVVLVCAFFISIIILFSRNYILLGGEGNYYTNFNLVKNTFSYSWHPFLFGTGLSNPTLNYPFPIINFFSLLQNIAIPYKVINILFISLIYMLPFLSLFWLLNKVLKIKFHVSFLISLFYILNPFSTYHLQGMMFWNTAPLFVLPFIFGLIYKYYLNGFRLFFIFGLATSLLSFSFANIPYLGIFHIFLILSIILISHLRKIEFKTKIIFKNILVTELGFLLFNFWWFINLFRFYLQDINNFYTKSFATSWTKYASGNGDIVHKLLSVKMLLYSGYDYFFSNFYFNPFVIICLFIPFVILTIFLLLKTRKNRELVMLVFAFLLLILFFNKGTSNPLGIVYVWLMENIPFFIIFKSPLEKFSVLFVFLLSLNLALVFRDVKNKLYYGVFIFYLLICGIPYISLNFMPDFKIEEDKYVSRRYIYKENYFNVASELNNDKLDYRYLSLPGSLNYQVTMLNHDGNKYYRGMDPVVYSINKPFIAAYSDLIKFNLIFDNFSNKNIEDILNIYNIKKVMINEDIYPAFGFKEKESVGDLLKIFSWNNEINTNGSMSLVSRKDFLPHIYTPTDNIVSERADDQLSRIISSQEWNTRSAVFFKSKNIFCPTSKINEVKQCGITKIEDEKNKLADSLPRKIENLPTLEFKKINPTKYRIRVHSASGVFPLVFSESFHSGWKSYLTPVKSGIADPPLAEFNGVNNYKILDGNEEDQASVDELKDFIKNGWVSTLGNPSDFSKKLEGAGEKKIKHMKWNEERQKEELDYVEKYNIDFISKNFQGTIQNDNLPAGHFWETWFQKPLSEENHLMANGYANSWIIDANIVCDPKNNSSNSSGANCVRNADGSYDFEIVVEFWPQRLFYIGLFISGTTLFACFGYLIYDWRKKRKPEVAGPGSIIKKTPGPSILE